ncbi:unnamed protein product [Dovyalis caffra]|uniref:SANT domain-containing protein n=1 Tax=Dovyalis caffra TaxID=77055 RepID=A0AAV1RCN6_9ROSI|nr:unnamed protein product [Dovyalis caffra]
MPSLWGDPHDIVQVWSHRLVEGNQNMCAWTYCLQQSLLTVLSAPIFLIWDCFAGGVGLKNGSGMDAIEGNSEWNCIEDGSTEQSLSPGICDACRDPELLPRIGDEYQVQIPALMTECAFRLHVESPADMIILSATCHEFLVGLPISLMWISEEVGNIKHEPQDYHHDMTDTSNQNESVKPESIREAKIVPEVDLETKVELMDITTNSGIEVREPAKLCFQPEISNEMHCQLGVKDYCLVPGSVGNPWSDAEEDSFLLGLYIFGKNLVQVKNFVESKTLGDILSFYYGKFYRTDRYCKWSECRKIRSRKCIYGQRIFTGSRQHEMLSRLLPQLSEECKNILLEAAKAFGEGKMLLEEYVFTLKVTVGLHALVEAVGIGKGKQDLTGITMEPLKSNQVAPVRPEIPTGKACSTLTPVEIINYLTGGYRLSKARSNDLFWEAVWPRLLARGWHSEQPNDHGFAAASRHSLVFLIPGIKKFSRRKLVKGDHYFDSVSDVLNKVASDPMLLELDIGEDKGDGGKEETAWSNNLDQGDFPGQQRHCYLKPRTPSRASDSMMFTVVDTSLANGETKKMRELRSLPVGLMNISTSRSDSEDSDDDSSKKSTDESDSSGNLCSDRNKTTMKKTKKNDLNKGVFSERESVEYNALKQSFPINGSGFAKAPERIPKEQKADKCDDMQTKKAIKRQATRRVRPGDRKLLAPVAKRQQRLIACDQTKTSCGGIDSHGLKQDEPGCAGEGPNFREDFFSLVDPPAEKLSATSSSRGSPNISDECTLSCNSSGTEHPHEKLESRALIDLNIPIPQDAETEPSMREVTEVQDDQASRQIEDFGMQKISTVVCDSSQQPPNMNLRRHSTRNRPPTTKALEALACGFLSIKQKRKSRDDFSLGNRMSRPSRRARSKMRITENFSADMTDFEGNERGNGGCKSNSNMLRMNETLRPWKAQLFSAVKYPRLECSALLASSCNMRDRLFDDAFDTSQHKSANESSSIRNIEFHVEKKQPQLPPSSDGLVDLFKRTMSNKTAAEMGSVNGDLSTASESFSNHDGTSLEKVDWSFDFNGLIDHIRMLPGVPAQDNAMCAIDNIQSQVELQKSDFESKNTVLKGCAVWKNSKKE